MQVGQCLNKAPKSDVTKPPKHIRPGLIPFCKYTQLLARNPGMCLHSQPHNLMNVYSSWFKLHDIFMIWTHPLIPKHHYVYG